jgi:WD40 repeat protein
MVARGAGDVGCAHCTVIGAERSCQVCTRLVCANCGADWTTCPEPTGREVRLGRTARLRDVDPTGRIGLVTFWVGAMRLFDVRRLRWVESELPRHHAVHERQIVERLTPTGDVYSSHYTYAPSDNARAFDSLRKQTLALPPSAVEIDTNEHEPILNAGMTKDGHYYYVSSMQLVVVVAPDNTVRMFEPLPRRVIQACHFDVDTGVLASGSWGEVVLHRVVNDKIVSLDRVHTKGNVSWVAFEEPWLAACVEGRIHVWHVAENLSIGRERYEHDAGLHWNTGAISRDGRYLAMGINRKVLVHDLENDVLVEFDGHTDDICLVRFAGTDQLLVTADEDNRVILRPRTPGGYVRTLIDIDLPGDPIKLDLDEEIESR